MLSEYFFGFGYPKTWMVELEKRESFKISSPKSINFSTLFIIHEKNDGLKISVLEEEWSFSFASAYPMTMRQNFQGYTW